MALILSPLVLCPLIYFIAPEIFTGGEPVSISMIWSFIGLSMSYYGLIFSLFAALEVERISRKYIFKILSPELSRSVTSIAKHISKFANEPPHEISAQTFMHEAPVALRAASRIQNIEVRRVAKEAQVELLKFKSQITKSSPNCTTSGQIPGYWEMYQKISELADELKTQIEELRSM
ncbi:hypothetical protein [Blastomonas sp. AAP25]|uniref:hypothetical protein n=1 Tax=Blastomonas sp. AAP25 TaxID=1523416 RepID=UPI0018D1018F|nr:hypothetical protein [Blastomonas sp. AAP25]